MNLSMDCKKMLTPRASRKTPLKKEPSRLARCQPKDRAWGDFAFSSIYDGGQLCGFAPGRVVRA